MGRYPEVDLRRLRLLRVAERPTRVRVEEFGTVGEGAATDELLERLPRQLGGLALREARDAVVAARRAGRPVVLLVGAHVVKVGASPYLSAWLEHGVATHLAMHGAGAIHDLEIALFGTTSEDVEEQLVRGVFGLVEETGAFFFRAAREAVDREEGLGEALGRCLGEARAPHRAASLLARAYAERLPATVHVAIGTDTVHAHPAGDGASLGETSLRDFRILAHALLEAEGAVVLNLGSAVVLPEVFLKALTVAVHLGARLEGLTTVNLDQIQHYRPRVNLLERPTRRSGGRALALTGQHEFLLPLLCESVLHRLRLDPAGRKAAAGPAPGPAPARPSR
jgi:hypothetical protein